jgi:hypothetical protein|tara:strand:+ start:8189 stop:8776 length:588 start_codon:yes stop_codon:yes gene_type:complete
MKLTKVNIKKIKSNEENPRVIKNNKFKQLVKSIQEFPEMLNIRPVVVNNEMIVLGGNMRLKACQEAGLKEIPVLKVEDLNEEQQREFIIKDNVGFGDWDWDILANTWNTDQLQDWGMDVWKGAEDEEFFNLDGDVEGEEDFAPKASDDDYSLFEIVMFHENKLFLLNVLNKIKGKLNLKTTAEALDAMARNYKIK